MAHNLSIIKSALNAGRERMNQMALVFPAKRGWVGNTPPAPSPAVVEDERY